MSDLSETTALPDVPLRLLIGGEWCEASSGKRFATLNPATEEVLAEVSEAGAPEIDRRDNPAAVPWRWCSGRRYWA